MSLIPAELRPRLRTPLRVLAALLVLLCINMILGNFVASHVWPVEGLISAAMIALIALYPMDIIRAPPLLRLFAGIGVMWSVIIFALTMIDYATR